MITTVQHITIKPKRISMDTLGEMIKKGFDGAQRDLNSVANRIDQKIDGLETRIDGLELRFDGLDNKLDFKFTGLQNQIDNMTLNYTPRLEHNLLKDRVQKVERKVGIKANSLNP